MPWTPDSLPPEFDNITDPEFRAAIAERLNEVLPQMQGEDDPERAAIAAVAAEIAEQGDVPEPDDESRAPRAGARLDYSASLRGGFVELRSLSEQRVNVRGVDLIVGARQELLRATTTYQGRSRITVTPEHLEEMAANASEFPFIPIDFDHLSGKGPNGIAGGVILSDSLTVEDGKLYGIPAYNDHTASQVRDKKWLGVSPRFTLSATSKNTGKPVGAALLALSLTNTPQLHDITVATEFSDHLDSATENVAQCNQGDATARTIHEETMNLNAFAKALNMEGETDEGKLLSAIKSLMAGKKKDEEMSANVEELTAARDEAAERAAKAEADVAELSAKLEAATSELTDAEKQAVELSAKVEEFGKRLNETEAARKAEKAEAEVNEFALRLNLGKAEKELATALRALADESEAGANAWSAWKADAEKRGPEFPREFSGANAADEGESDPNADPFQEWVAYRDQRADGEFKFGADLADRDENAKVTEKGAKLHARAFGTVQF